MTRANHAQASSSGLASSSAARMTKITSSSTTKSLPKGINIIINNKIESEAQPIPIVRKKRRKRRKPIIPQLQEEFKLPAPVADASYVQKPTLPTSWRNTLNTDPQGTINPVITDDQKKALGFYHEDPPQKPVQITNSLFPSDITTADFYKAIQNMQSYFTNDPRIKGGATIEAIEDDDPVYNSLPNTEAKRKFIQSKDDELKANIESEVQKGLSLAPMTSDEETIFRENVTIGLLKQKSKDFSDGGFKRGSTMRANLGLPPTYTFNKVYMENYVAKLALKILNTTDKKRKGEYTKLLKKSETILAKL